MRVWRWSTLARLYACTNAKARGGKVLDVQGTGYRIEKKRERERKKRDGRREDTRYKY